MKYGTKALDAVVEIAIPMMGIANQWRSQASAVVCRTPVVDDQNTLYSGNQIRDICWLYVRDALMEMCASLLSHVQRGMHVLH